MASPRHLKRIKVLEILECGGPGGTGNQVAAICNGLDPELFDVGLVYSVRTGKPEDYRALAKGARSAFYLPEMVREISPSADLKAFWKLYRLFKEEKPDVVHAHSSKAGVLARAAAWVANVPRIFYSPRGYGFLQTDRPRSSRAAYRFLEKSVSWIGEIVAISPSEAELAGSLSWGKGVHTVCDAYLGPQSVTAFAPDKAGIRVGSCGRLTGARHPDSFLRLAQRLTDSRNDLACVWIGSGELEADTRQNITNMNMDSKVEVTGWLEPGEALKRMRGLDVFVHYSGWEGLPNAVLEAMTLGLPVVASDVPGNRDAVVHGKTGYIAGDEIELLEYTLKLVDAPDLRRRMGEAGRERAEREFSRERAIGRLSDIYLGR